MLGESSLCFDTALREELIQVQEIFNGSTYTFKSKLKNLEDVFNNIPNPNEFAVPTAEQISLNDNYCITERNSNIENINSVESIKVSDKSAIEISEAQHLNDANANS